LSDQHIAPGSCLLTGLNVHVSLKSKIEYSTLQSGDIS